MRPMNCPRCSAAVTTAPDDAGFIVCPGCGIRLKRTPAASRGPAPVGRAGPGEPHSDEPADPPQNPAATLPPGTPLKRIPRPEELERGVAPQETLETLLVEVRALRRAQDEMLRLLKLRSGSAAWPLEDDFPGLASGPAFPEGSLPELPEPTVRSRRRKTALLIDDDEATRRAAVKALEQAEIPVRAAADGSAGLAAIAQEKPDVIILELGMGGSMPGKDVINMIKATIEWLDIPIVLYTRLPVASQKEARTIHGADELVSKSSPRAAEALTAQVIAQFRKG